MPAAAGDFCRLRMDIWEGKDSQDMHHIAGRVSLALYWESFSSSHR